MKAMSATREYDTIVIGGGPAGLFAAIRLAEARAAALDAGGGNVGGGNIGGGNVGGREGRGGAGGGNEGSGNGSPGGTGIGGDAGGGNVGGREGNFAASGRAGGDNEAGGKSNETGNNAACRESWRATSRASNDNTVATGREIVGTAGCILVLEKREKPGRKLLLSGSGQCNITHSGDIEEFLKHYGGGARPESAARFLKPALLNFTNDDLLAWFGERGMEFETEENGKVFPVCRKSSAVLEILVEECERLGVDIKPNRRVMQIEHLPALPDATHGYGVFRLRVEEGENRVEEYSASAVLIATGGVSYPRTGSSGDGYALAKALGHSIVEPRPALAPVFVKEFALGDLAGLSFKGAGLKVKKWGLTPTLKAGNTFQFEGDLLITHEGFSGPLILDASRHIKAGDTLEICFADEKLEKFRTRLVAALAANPKRLVRTVLPELGLTKSMVERFCDLAGIATKETGSVLSRVKRDELCRMACGFQFVVERMGSLETAMVTAGGVELSEVNPKTMESRLISGLYFAGEVLDVDGDSGGYNLQAAFSTGALVAKLINGV